MEHLLRILKQKISDKTPAEKYYISRERHVKCLISVKNHLISTKNDKSVDLILFGMKKETWYAQL